MNLDEQKTEWRQRHKEMANELVDASKTVEQSLSLEKALSRRDFTEAIAAGIVLVVFTYYLLTLSFPVLSQIGIATIMIGAVTSVSIMYWTRQRDVKPDQDWPLLDFCKAELLRVDRQIVLLRYVTFWYSGPLIIGAALMLTGIMFALPKLPPVTFYGFLFAFYACFIAVGVILYRGNMRAVKTQLMPVREELTALAASLEKEAPLQEPT